MIADAAILALIFCGVLTGIAYKIQSLPVMFISSLGLCIAALQMWGSMHDILPTVLLMLIAFAQVSLIRSERAV